MSAASPNRFRTSRTELRSVGASESPLHAHPVRWQTPVERALRARCVAFPLKEACAERPLHRRPATNRIGTETSARTPQTAGSLRKTPEAFPKTPEALRKKAEALGKTPEALPKTPEALRKKAEAFPKKAGLFRQSLGLFSPPSEAKWPKSPVFQQKRPFSSKLLSSPE